MILIRALNGSDFETNTDMEGSTSTFPDTLRFEPENPVDDMTDNRGKETERMKTDKYDNNEK